MKQRITEKFQTLFQTSGEYFASAGRINLIGEHTDYNGGFVVQEFLPEGLSGHRFYTPNTQNAQEAKIAERIHALWGSKYDG